MRTSAVTSARRGRRFSVLLAAIGLIGGAAVVGLAIFGGVVHPEAAAADMGDACLTWRDPGTGEYKLSRVDVADGGRVTVAALPYRVNAVGFAAGREALYGLTPPRDAANGVHLVRIDAESGETGDLGPVDDGGVHVPGLSGAYIGAMVGDDLVVAAGDWIVWIDVDPGSPRFGSIVDRRGVGELPPFGDWVYDPLGRQLYALTGADGGALVRVDPFSGRTWTRPVGGLPRTGYFGAAFLAPGRVLYAVAGSVGGRAVLYRVPLEGVPRARPVASWPALDSTDATYCPRRPRPSPSSPSPSPSSPSPSPSSPSPSPSSPSPSPSSPSPSPSSPSPSSPSPSSPSPSPSTSPSTASTSAAPEPTTPSPSAPSPTPPGPSPNPPEPVENPVPPPVREPTQAPSPRSSRKPPSEEPPVPPAPPLPRVLAVPVPPEDDEDTAYEVHRKRALIVGAIVMAVSGSAGARSLRRRG